MVLSMGLDVGSFVCCCCLDVPSIGEEDLPSMVVCASSRSTAAGVEDPTPLLLISWILFPIRSKGEPSSFKASQTPFEGSARSRSGLDLRFSARLVWLPRRSSAEVEQLPSIAETQAVR